MSDGRAKRGGEYSRAVFDIEAPKTAWMAVAFSLALRLCDDNFVAAKEMIWQEWGILHENGIVPQKPRRL